MTDPFFTVIVPLYNKGPHVERALRGVIGQTFGEWELVLVNDASTDDGPALAGKLLAHDSRCRILDRSVPGPGGYAARNLAASVASGSWLAFLDADDEWEPDHLANLAGTIGTHPGCGFACTGVYEVMPDGKKTRNESLESLGMGQNGALGLLSYIQLGCAGRNPVFTSACAIERSLFNSIGGFPEGGTYRRGGDRDTWLRAIGASDLAWTAKPTATYHRDAENMVTKTVPFTLDLCMDGTIRAMLADRKETAKTPGLARALKLLANYERKRPIRKRIRNGTVSFDDFRILYKSVEPVYAAYVLICAVLPKKLLSRIFATPGGGRTST